MALTQVWFDYPSGHLWIELSFETELHWAHVSEYTAKLTDPAQDSAPEDYTGGVLSTVHINVQVCTLASVAADRRRGNR